MLHIHMGFKLIMEFRSYHTTRIRKTRYKVNYFYNLLLGVIRLARILEGATEAG